MENLFGLHPFCGRDILAGDMDKITISRGTQQLGQFTDEEALAGLRSGQFSLADLWWKAGMEKWEPLSAFPNAETPDFAPPPLGAGTPDSIAEIPWENERLGFFERFWQTNVNILTDPWKAFAQMPVSGGYGKPSLFVFIAIVLGSFVQVIEPIILRFIPSEAHGYLTWYFTSSFPELIIDIPCAIALGVISTLVFAGVTHLCLMLFGAAHRDFEATFRACVYSWAPFYILVFVPCFGMLITLTWGVVVEIVALKKAHRADYWRVICASLLPLLLCCGCIAAGLAVPTLIFLAAR